jgi:hypothetical protein
MTYSGSVTLQLRKFGSDTVRATGEATGVDRDAAIFLTLLFFVVLFAVMRWMVRRTPERNTSPAEPSRGVSSIANNDPTGPLP